MHEPLHRALGYDIIYLDTYPSPQATEGGFLARELLVEVTIIVVYSKILWRFFVVVRNLN